MNVRTEDVVKLMELLAAMASQAKMLVRAEVLCTYLMGSIDSQSDIDVAFVKRTASDYLEALEQFRKDAKNL